MFIIEYKFLILTAWLILFRLFEGIRPAARCPDEINQKQRWFKNLGLFSLTALSSVVIVLPVTLWASQNPLWIRSELLSSGFALIGDLIFLDFLIYWWHRANHQIAFLWRFHEIHHLDRFLDTTTALRFHFAEVLLSAVFRCVVIILCAIPLRHILVFETLVMMAALFHHSNVKLPRSLEKWMSWFFVTPSIHWVHHHALKKDTDQNYATILSLWDRLFRTKSPTHRWPKMPIGVDFGKATAVKDLAFLPLLLRPFTK